MIYIISKTNKFIADYFKANSTPDDFYYEVYTRYDKQLKEKDEKFF
jgi:hypothetical protein